MSIEQFEEELGNELLHELRKLGVKPYINQIYLKTADETSHPVFRRVPEGLKSSTEPTISVGLWDGSGFKVNSLKTSISVLNKYLRDNNIVYSIHVQGGEWLDIEECPVVIEMEINEPRWTVE